VSVVGDLVDIPVVPDRYLTFRDKENLPRRLCTNGIAIGRGWLKREVSSPACCDDRRNDHSRQERMEDAELVAKHANGHQTSDSLVRVRI
jgi:hypothetical protein